MNIPSTTGFKVKDITFPPEWENLVGAALVLKMEEWAEINLHQRQAVVGTHTYAKNRHDSEGTWTHDQFQAGPSVAVINFWILRHTDYSTGRAKIEIQVRIIGPHQYDGTIVWTSENDVLKKIHLSEYNVKETYARIGNVANPTRNASWVLTSETVSQEHSLTDLPPLARIPKLALQCRQLGREIGKSLYTLLPEDAKVTGGDHLKKLLELNMFWLFAHPEQHRTLYRAALSGEAPSTPTDVRESLRQFSYLFHGEIVQPNRIAEERHFRTHSKLYEFHGELRAAVQAGAALTLQQVLDYHQTTVAMYFDSDKFK